MSAIKSNFTSVPRGQWPMALMQTDKQALIKQIDHLAQHWQISAVAPADSGLAMLCLRDSTQGEAFNLGEFPLSQVWLEISCEDGKTAQGACNLMHDDLKLTQAIAIADAILANELSGFELIAQLVNQGSELLEQKTKQRKAMLARTKVDFDLLDGA